MLGYATLGTSDMERAEAFYNELFTELGGKQLFGMDRIKFYGTSTDEPMIALCIPYNEEPHERGNGQMVALMAADRATVDRVHAIALAQGGTCEGPPGLRPHYHADYYGAYFRDPDGNKLCVCCHTPSTPC